MKTCLFFLWAMVAAACSLGQGSSDAGCDDGQSGTDGGDTGYHPDGITLHIPQGFALCNMNGLWNMLQLPMFKFRAEVLAGDWSLPLDQEEFELDLIGRVTTSPGGVEVPAAGPGRFRFWRNDWGPEYPEYCVFQYMQPFQAAAGTFDVTFGFYLECQEGVVWEMPDNLGPATYPCEQLDEYTAGHVSATAVNGDRIEFDYYFYEGCAKSIGDGICPTYYGDPIRGRFVRGQYEKVTTDYYDLALSCVHHGFPATFLMVFEEPLDGVHAVVLDDDQPIPAEMRYLDSSLSVTSTVDVQDIHYD